MAQYPPWWHEGTAKPGEHLTGIILTSTTTRTASVSAPSTSSSCSSWA